MDYNTLLELATGIGYRLAMCGAETFRVEESILRLMESYGIEAEAFAIPNCLTVSIKTPDGLSLTKMRRIGHHGNDLDSVERYSNLSRKICTQHPEPETAVLWLREADANRKYYGMGIHLFGNFLGACGFAIFYGSSFLDSLLAGICGTVVGCIGLFMDRLKANLFFRTIIAAFLMSLLAYSLASYNIVQNADTVIIGTLMILVPGLLFTNAMRDIIYGDTNSGINRIVQVFLIALAIALGTASAWNVVAFLGTTPVIIPDISNGIAAQLAGCCIGCIGFSILFNIHGPGGLLCTLGGIIAWSAFCVTLTFGGSDLDGYFFAAIIAALYSEIMARIRKYPAISYLVVSIFPLIPGASVYYTMTYAVCRDMDDFASQGLYTIAIAGCIAVGVLMVSTSFRLWANWKRNQQAQKKLRGL